MQKQKLIIYWSRRDFRLTDNPALFKAIAKSKENNTLFLPIFILENYMTNADPKFQFGHPSQYFLTQALPFFAKNFNNFTVFRGTTFEIFENLKINFDLEIFVNEDIHPDFYKQILHLQKVNFKINVFNDQLTIRKDTVSGTGNFYTVFSPFKKNIWQQFLDYPEVGLSLPQDAFEYTPSINELDSIKPSKIFLLQPAVLEGSLVLDSKNLLNAFTTDQKIIVGNNTIDLKKIINTKPNLDNWYWSESSALQIFDTYLDSELLSKYKQNRDSLELDTENLSINQITIHGKTSKMSLGLAWGLVSSRTLKNKILKYYGQNFDNFMSTTPNQGALCFLSELIWREFYKYIFYHKPEVIDTEFQEKFRGTIAWVDKETALVRFIAWIKGQTGYPAVDAAMNQLAQTGWMHNRARMMVASILTKNLGVDWRWGQEYFRAALIDLDEASNNGGWQWGSSTGSDPKPIRIFNPYLQAENYDKQGLYQKKWLPRDYIEKPLVEHKDARSQAMQRYGLSERGAARDF